MSKKLLSILLSLILMFSVFDFTAVAQLQRTLLPSEHYYEDSYARTVQYALGIECQYTIFENGDLEFGYNPKGDIFLYSIGQ